MTGLSEIQALADLITSYLVTHAPWVADKLGGTIISLPVKEVWDLVKRKLSVTQKGKQAIESIEAEPSSQSNAQLLHLALSDTISAPPEFAGQLRELLSRGAVTQSIFGDENQQVQVTNAERVKITIS